MISIRQRLSMLVLTQIMAGALVLFTAVLLLGKLRNEQEFLAGFVFPPLAEIEVAMADTADLRGVLESTDRSELAARASPIIQRLRVFVAEYRKDWEVADSPTPMALRQLAELKEAHMLWLVDDERNSINALQTLIDRVDRDIQISKAAGSGAVSFDPGLAALDRGFLRLGRVNVQYIEASFKASVELTIWARRLLVLVGVASILAATLLGMSVHQAIAPRVEDLVAKIKRFRELGVYEPSFHQGDDELAILARALDLSFAAIMQRDKEREHFLAIAAHELKTPLSAMKGFANAALAHREDNAIRERALTVIDRQATRLSRLIQDLLWLARAQAGDLPFRPSPVDLEALARRVIGDVDLVAKERRFEMVARGDAHILGDIDLLEHTIWSLLAQAATLASGDAPVLLVLDSSPNLVRLSVETESREPLPYDLDEITAPFAMLHHEDRRAELRSTGLGLPLVRQIARLHGATFQVERRMEKIVVFKLELPR